MIKQKQLVAINLDCERKNKFFNIEGFSEEKIKEIENKFDKKLWIMHRR